MAGIHNVLAGASVGFSFSQTIAADTTNYNLRTAALAGGWDGTTPLVAAVTINSGVVVSSNAVGTHAFDTGTTAYPAGSSLSVVNNGFIIGMGGNGGSSPSVSGTAGPTATVTFSAATVGGPALRTNLPTTFDNTNGTVGGGGGGAGGGRAPHSPVDGKFGYQAVMSRGGGGGGGRSGRTNSAGGGVGGPGSGWGIQTIVSPTGGGAGTFAAAGNGGAADGINGSNNAGTGGIGGGWGSAGATGNFGNGYAGYINAGPNAGAAAGAAVVGNANITWLATGTRLGAIT